MSNIDEKLQGLIAEAMKAGPACRGQTGDVRKAIIRNIGSIKVMQARGFRNTAIARILGDVPATPDRAAKPGIGVRWETVRKYLDEYAPAPKRDDKRVEKRVKRTRSALVNSPVSYESGGSSPSEGADRFGPSFEVL